MSGLHVLRHRSPFSLSNSLPSIPRHLLSVPFVLSSPCHSAALASTRPCQSSQSRRRPSPASSSYVRHVARSYHTTIHLTAQTPTLFLHVNLSRFRSFALHVSRTTQHVMKFV
ncbi:hypothetical protein BD410DRAFT_321352 [Rickenella mellea]|uniref:Uncharacterized protein n=1 Tax=Rickenella mellea TaxID=50990 RepID=A0A4Y7Q2C1_9AGAM|nr:hypothetical protein BD410DRAFT_321352 [Rickenella mellea]